MSTDTMAARAPVKPTRRTTAQLLAAAAKDTDAVSVFCDGTYAGDSEAAIFVVKGMHNVEYLTSICQRQGLLTDKPVETDA